MFAAGALGFFFGAGGTLAYFEYFNRTGITRREAPTSTAIVPSRAPKHAEDESAMKAYQDMGKYGYPSNDTVYVKHGYISSFDPMLRIPRWVMELLTPSAIEVKGASRDHSKFYLNEAIPEMFRATNGDYATARGFSRGHLAPAQFHRDSQTSMDATFDLNLNAVPQDMACNASDWLRVENLCKKIAKEATRLYVVTGPLFIPKEIPGPRPRSPPRTVVEYEVIGTHHVAVPTHLFKSVLAEGRDGSITTATFVVPNSPMPEDRPLTAYLVPKEQVERWSGLQLFPQAASSAGNLCARYKCDASAGGLGSLYRSIAKLRVAPTSEALEKAWSEIRAQKDKIDDALVKEYEYQKASFNR